MLTALRLALRTTLKTAALSAVAVVCLAMAIGMTTAVFGVVHGAFFSDLPLPRGDRLVIVQDYHRAGGYNVPMTAAAYTDRRRRSRSFADTGAWFSRSVTVDAGSGAAPVVVRAAYVSPNALAVVGLVPAQGRLPATEDVAPGAPPVVLIGQDFLERRLGAGDAMLTRSIDIAGRPHRVVGVLPRGVRFPIKEDLWIPVQVDARSANATPESLTFFGVLAPGVTREQAAAELAAISMPDMAVDPAAATLPVVMPFARGFMSPDAELAMYALVVGLVLFLIVIATNLANLFLARNSARRREIAVRAALGASRRHLVRPLLLEALILGGAGAIGGLVVARVIVDWFLGSVTDIPWWADFSLNPAVITFAAVVALLASTVAGVGPAMRLTRGAVVDELKSADGLRGGLRFSRAGAALLALQMAVSVGCLSVVSVLAQSLFGFSYQRYGINADDVLIAQVYLGPPEDIPAAVDRRTVWERHFQQSRAQIERIRAHLLTHPGVRQVTYATHFPGNDVARTTIEIQGGASLPVRVDTRIAEIGPGFFETIGASLTFGRDFTDADRRGVPRAVIVNVPFARKHVAGTTPIGRLLRVVDAAGSPGPWLEIVGVAPDLGLNPGDASRADGIYVAFTPSNFARFGVRAATDPAAIVPAVHQIVGRENRRAQVQAAETLATLMRTAESVFRGLGGALAALGATALLLSAMSFYSLVSLGVRQRRRDIGIQLALGATGARILRSVLGRELGVMLTGAIGGMIVGAGVYQLVQQIPFDLSPAAPFLIGAPIALIVVVGIGACAGPARRALAIQPAEALRRE